MEHSTHNEIKFRGKIYGVKQTSCLKLRQLTQQETDRWIMQAVWLQEFIDSFKWTICTGALQRLKLDLSHNYKHVQPPAQKK